MTYAERLYLSLASNQAADDFVEMLFVYVGKSQAYEFILRLATLTAWHANQIEFLYQTLDHVTRG